MSNLLNKQEFRYLSEFRDLWNFGKISNIRKPSDAWYRVSKSGTYFLFESSFSVFSAAVVAT